jgi:hypothetical protein
VSLTWEKSERDLLRVQAAPGRRGGVNAVQALVWNMGPVYRCPSFSPKPPRRAQRPIRKNRSGEKVMIEAIMFGSSANSLLGTKRLPDTGSYQGLAMRPNEIPYSFNVMVKILRNLPSAATIISGSPSRSRTDMWRISVPWLGSSKNVQCLV